MSRVSAASCDGIASRYGQAFSMTPGVVPSQRSTFVTVVAWLFIVGSGMCTPIALLQNVMVWTVFPREALRAGADDAGPAAWIARSPELLVLGFLCACVVTLVASIGLLRRQRWARTLFTAVLVAIIALQLIGFALQLSFVFGSEAPFDRVAGFGGLVVGIVVTTAIFAVAICGGLAWLIKRLYGPDVTQEFVA